MVSSCICAKVFSVSVFFADTLNRTAYNGYLRKNLQPFFNNLDEEDMSLIQNRITPRQARIMPKMLEDETVEVSS